MRRPRPASLRRAFPLAALLPVLALGACVGPGRDEFAPACPIARPLPEAEHLRRYRDPNSPDGQDPSQLVVSGLLLGVDGKCRPGDNAHQLHATMTVRMRLDRGPAAPPGGVDIPYFIAVADGTHMLSRQVFVTHVAFPADSGRVVLTSAPVAVMLPVGPTRSGAAYTIWVGFQLTPAEVKAETAR